MNRLVALPLLMLAAGTGRALAQDCSGLDDVDHAAALSVATVTDAVPRVYFVKNRSDRPNCPADARACRGRAFLVPGNPVIVSGTHAKFSCVTYLGRRGSAQSGWIPSATLRMQASRTSWAPADWSGTWTAPEQLITIKPGRDGALDVDGSATFGALDRERVRRGAVNVGGISGSAKPEGAILAFTMAGDGKTLPYDAGQESDCRIRLRLVGPYLLAEDNNDCGGFNVSFSRLYRRKN